MPFTCRGCKEKFTTQTDIVAAKPKNDNQRLAWQSNHEGQRPHAPPLLPIDPYYMVPCVLHVMLRMVDNLFSHTVRVHINTQERENAMNDVLRSMGIYVKKVKKTKEQIKTKAMEETKFHGRDCEKILMQKKVQRGANLIEGYKAIIDAMQYAEEGDITKSKAIELWDALAALVNELSEEWPGGPEDIYDPSKQGERDDRADVALELGRQYLQLFVKYVGADKVTLYLHVCAVHIPNFIRRCGSLREWSMQALEHCHSLRKKSWRVACNKRHAGGRGRKRKDGTYTTIKRGYMATELARQHALSDSAIEVPERPTRLRT